MTAVTEPATRWSRLRTGTAALVVAAAVITTAGCGVPLDDAPRAITRTTLAPSVTPTTVAPAGASEVSVYFLDEERLQAQPYSVEGLPTLSGALAFALQSPAEGSPSSLRTAVPPNTTLRSAGISGGIARIDLTGDINNVSGETQKQAFAQLVFTALSFPGVRRVRFQIDGKDVDVLTDDGSKAVVTAGDYKAPLSPR